MQTCDFRGNQGTRAPDPCSSGKSLVLKPGIATTDDHNEKGRAEPFREHPFTGSTNDVVQVTCRCNVDVQFLPRAPVIADEEDGDADQAADENDGEAAQLAANAKDSPAGLYGLRARLTGPKRSLWRAIQAMYRASLVCDYYITKYASKMNQTLQPIMDQLTQGLQRLEQERAEEEARSARAQPEEESAPPSKARRGSYYARARRTAMRLATAANRSIWMSFAEIYIIVTTRDDCFKTHAQHTLFTKRLLFMMEQCKRQLESRTLRVDDPQATVTALLFEPCDGPAAAAEADRGERGHRAEETGCKRAPPGDDEAMDHGLCGDESMEPEDPTSDNEAAQPAQKPQPESGASAEDKAEAASGAAQPAAKKKEPFTMKALGDSTSDDWRHRGPKLRDMSLFVYNMYVQRMPKSKVRGAWGGERSCAARCFEFDAHYGMSTAYNAKYKMLLFGDAVCSGQGQCQDVLCFRHYLAETASGKQSWHEAWKARRAVIEVAARAAEAKKQRSLRELVLADTTLCKRWCPLVEEQEQAMKLTRWFKLLLADLLDAALPDHSHGAQHVVFGRILSFSCLDHLWRSACAPLAEETELRHPACATIAAGVHADQLTLWEFTAFLSRDIIENVDLLAEARSRPPKDKNAKGHVEAAAEDDDDGAERAAPDLDMQTFDLGGVEPEDDDDDVDFGDDIADRAKFPLASTQEVFNAVLRHREVRSDRIDHREAAWKLEVCSLRQ